MGIPPRHLPEFRRHLVELYQSGRELSSLTKEFGVPAWPIRRWARQAERDKAGVDNGLSPVERRELSRPTSVEAAAPADGGSDHVPAPSLTMHFIPWESTPGVGGLPHVPVPLGTVQGGVIREVLAEWQMRCSRRD